MKMLRSLKTLAALAGLFCASFIATPATAQLSFLVDINTSSLVNQPAGPFYLDFSSFFGSGSAQTITVSNFSLTGGSLLPGTATSTGAVSGSLATSLVFNPNSGSFLNEFYQQFGPTVNDIKFKLDLSANPSGVTPTSFAVAILDSNLANIPTTGLGDSLLFFNLDGRSSNYQSATGLGVSIAVIPVPEPSTYGLMAGGILLVGVLYRRRARQS